MRAAIIIPNWDGATFIRPCLDSLAKQTLPHRVIVVDNGSVDDSVAIIEREYPEVQLVKLPHNTGFAGGVNRGIKAAMEQGYEYVALFNNDAEATPDWLEQLVATAERLDEAGIVTGKLMQKRSATIDSTGELYSTWGFPFPRGRDERDTGQYDAEEWVFGATGGATLYRTRMLRDIGLFDEAYFAYYEDVDISFRAQLAGWKVRYQPKAVAHHLVGATSSRQHGFARSLAIRNFQYLYLKNMPGLLYWKYLPLFVTATLLQLGSSIAKGQLLSHLRAWLEAIVALPRTVLKRHPIQSRRLVSLDYIDSLLYRGLPPTQKRLLALARRLRGA